MNRRTPGMFILVLMLAVSLALAAGPDEKAKAESCVKAAAGPLGLTLAAVTGTPAAPTAAVPAPLTVARVGKPAPDFEATAFQNGAFKNVKLSDFKGKWVVLCFYPGDFTFV